MPMELKHMIETKSTHAVSEARIKTMTSNTPNTLAKMSAEGIELDYTTPRCNRARLDTGPFCNYDCEFCYYRDQLDVKIPWEIVQKRIHRLLDYGITEVDLSGGESSVSPDWIKILDYCNERFDHVSCLSHGGKFSDKEFVQEAKDHGLKEILFSLHGATEEVHDKITGRKGSFKRILQGIANAKEIGLIVRTNATIYYRNYHQLENEYADLLNSIMPTQANFITLNYWGDYNIIEFENISYKDMCDNIIKCISKLNDGIEVNARYAPFCYMKGAEKYVCGTYQHIYDVKDWNREMYTPAIDVSKPYTLEEKIKMGYDCSADHRQMFYSKKLECLTCKHFYICDGIEKEIADKTPVFPEPGEKIKQVNYYRHDRDKR